MALIGLNLNSTAKMLPETQNPVIFLKLPISKRKLLYILPQLSEKAGVKNKGWTLKATRFSQFWGYQVTNLTMVEIKEFPEQPALSQIFDVIPPSIIMPPTQKT